MRERQEEDDEQRAPGSWTSATCLCGAEIAAGRVLCHFCESRAEGASTAYQDSLCDGCGEEVAGRHAAIRLADDVLDYEQQRAARARQTIPPSGFERVDLVRAAKHGREILRRAHLTARAVESGTALIVEHLVEGLDDAYGAAVRSAQEAGLLTELLAGVGVSDAPITVAFADVRNDMQDVRKALRALLAAPKASTEARGAA